MSSLDPISVPTARRSGRYAGWLAALVVASACSGYRPGDLAELYAARAAVVRRTPLIVIPGVMGSRLARTADGREVWPGRLPALVVGASFRALELPLDDTDALHAPGVGLEPHGLFDRAAGRSFYRDLVAALEQDGGYHCVAPSRIDEATDCVLLDWDWRQDVVEGARRLATTIARLRGARAAPGLAVDVVAHSAGGLVARYYLRFGGEDVLERETPPSPDARSRGIDQLLLVGTPNFGAISAVQNAMFGLRFPLGRAGAEVMASLPGIAELFPHPDLDWMIERDGGPSDLDLFAVETWRRYRVGIYAPAVERRLRARLDDPADFDRVFAEADRRFAHALARGASFHRALSQPLGPTPTAIHVFGSGCEPTPARCLVEHDGDALRMVTRPEQIRDPRPDVDYRRLMLEPGDGSVTKSSLLGRASLLDGGARIEAFPVRSSVFICAPHTGLSSDPTFLDNLLQLLLYREE